MNTRRKAAAFVVVSSLSMVTASVAAADPAPTASEATKPQAISITDRFVEHIRASDAVNEAARQVITEQWEQRRSSEDARSFLTESLAVISPDFKKGLQQYESGEFAAAAETMAGLTNHENPYLSTNAAVFEARSLVEAERIEAAHERLIRLAENESTLRAHSLHAPDVRFLIGYCQLHTLNYEDAIKTLGTFERDFPDAPERLRATARQIELELRRRQPDGIGDVADLMAYAGRRLGNGVSDEPVTSKQAKAVALLDELIKEMEKKECEGGSCKSCGGKGCKACRGGAPKGNQQPSSPANKSMLPGGSSQTGELRRTVARPGEVWGKMPEAERERILQAIKKNFPTRYRELVEQYYRQLARQQ